VVAAHEALVARAEDLVDQGPHEGNVIGHGGVFPARGRLIVAGGRADRSGERRYRWIGGRDRLRRWCVRWRVSNSCVTGAGRRGSAGALALRVGDQASAGGGRSGSGSRRNERRALRAPRSTRSARAGAGAGSKAAAGDVRGVKMTAALW